MKKFILVCCDSKVFKSQYKRSRTTESINHEDILFKLETNDIYKTKPTRQIVKFFIINKINKALHNQSIENIYYRVDTIDSEVIESIKLLLNTFNTKLESFDLILHKSQNLTSLKKKFNSIIEFNDKT